MVSRYMPGDMPIPNNPYKLIELLGEGGFGQVWKCHGPGGTLCALKFIALDSQGIKEYRAIRRVKLIKHPNLVPIQAIWLKDEYDNLLDEESAGSSLLASSKASELIIAMGLGEKSLAVRLNECLKEGKPGIPIRELFGYTRDAAKALQYLNFPTESGRSSIRHGDIKPGNMLIVGGTGVQVCDFGLAEVLTGTDISITVTKRKAFTPAYMAPELIQGKGNQLSDLFSLAISYVELRTGHLPFQALSPEHAMILIASGKFDLDRVSHPREREILARAMHTEPAERYESYTDFVDELEEALHDDIRPPRRPLSSGEFKPVSNPELRPTAGADLPRHPLPTSIPSIRVRKPVPMSDLLRPNVELVPNHRLKSLRAESGGPMGGQIWNAFNPHGRPVVLEILGELPGQNGFDPKSVVAKLTGGGGNKMFWLINEHGDQLKVSDLELPEVTCQAVVINQSVPLTELVLPGRDIIPGYKLRHLTGEPGRHGGIVYEATDPQGRACYLEIFGDAPGLPPLKLELIDRLREHSRTYWLINDFGQPVRRSELGRPDLQILGVVILQKITLHDLLQKGRELVPGHVLKESEPESGRHGGLLWDAIGPGGKLCGLEILGDDGSGQFRAGELTEKLRKEGILRPGVVWFIDATGRPFPPGSSDRADTEPAAVVIKQRADLSRMLIPNRELVPNFVLKKKLGQGGYGQVWEAVGPGRKPCALKIVNLSGNQGRQELRSLRLMRELDNAHLLELQNCWLLDEFGEVIPEEQWDNPGGIASATLIVGTKLAAMNLLNKLEEYQRHGKPGIPPGDLLRYMRQAADAIDYLNAEIHELDGKKISIIHRDIKPENILLTRNDEVMVSDFGLAKVMEGERGHISTDSRGFTVYYAAPEVLTRDDVTRTSDQYSLAVTYFQLRVGELPFDRKAPAIQLMIQLGEGRLDLDALEDPAEREVVARATSRNPDERYPSCADFVAELARVLQMSMSELQIPRVGGSSSPDVQVATSGTQSGGLPRTDPISTPQRSPVAVAEARPSWGDGGQTVGPDGIPLSDTPRGGIVPGKQPPGKSQDRSAMLGELNISQTIIPGADMRMTPPPPPPPAAPPTKTKVNVPSAPPPSPEVPTPKPRSHPTHGSGNPPRPNLVHRLKPGIRFVGYELREWLSGGETHAVWKAVDARGQSAELKIYSDLGGVGWRQRAERYPGVARALKREESLGPKVPPRHAFVLDRKDKDSPKFEWSNPHSSAESVVLAEPRGGGNGRLVSGIVGAVLLVVGGVYAANHFGGQNPNAGDVPKVEPVTPVPVVTEDGPGKTKTVEPPPPPPRSIVEIVRDLEKRFADGDDRNQILAELNGLNREELAKNYLDAPADAISLLIRSGLERPTALTPEQTQEFENLFRKAPALSKYIPRLAEQYLLRAELEKEPEKIAECLKRLPQLSAETEARQLADYLKLLSQPAAGNGNPVFQQAQALYGKKPYPPILNEPHRRQRVVALLDKAAEGLWRPEEDALPLRPPFRSFESNLLAGTLELAEQLDGQPNPTRSARLAIVSGYQTPPKWDKALEWANQVPAAAESRLGADAPYFELVRANAQTLAGQGANPAAALDKFAKLVDKIDPNQQREPERARGLIEKVLNPAVEAGEKAWGKSGSAANKQTLAGWLGKRGELRLKLRDHAKAFQDFRRGRELAEPGKLQAEMIAGQWLAFRRSNPKPVDETEFLKGLKADAVRAHGWDPENPRVIALKASAIADEAGRSPKLNADQTRQANEKYQEALNLYLKADQLAFSDELEKNDIVIKIVNLTRHLRTQWVEPDKNKKLCETYLKKAEAFRELEEAHDWYLLGLTYEESAWLDGNLHDYQSAVSAFDKAISLNNSKPEYYISRARTRYRSVVYGGEPADFLINVNEDLVSVLELLNQPDAKKLYRGEAELYYGESLVLNNQFKEADKYFIQSYNNLKDYDVSWLKMAYYARARCMLDWHERGASGALRSDERLNDAQDHMNSLANFFQETHKLQSEADWLRGKALALKREDFQKAADRFALYLPSKFPDNLDAFRPKTDVEWPIAIARLKFLVEWIDLHLKDNKLEGHKKLDAAKLEEIADVMAELGTSRFNQEIDLKARALAISGLTLNMASGKLPANQRAKQTELRSRAKERIAQALKLITDKYPGVWEWYGRAKSLQENLSR